MKRTKSVCVDLDNTIYNERPSKEKVFDTLYEAMIESGLVQSKNEAHRQVQDYTQAYFKRFGFYTWNEPFYHFGGLDFKELLRQNRELIIPFDGVFETLEHLQSKYKLALVTDGARDYTEVKLDLLGIRKYFPVIITTDETRTMKPEPTGWLMAAERLGIELIDCVAVGDNVNDAISIQKADMRAIIINSDSRVREEVKQVSPEVTVLERFEELINIL